MDKRYQIMTYRQDLPGFGEPLEGMWDGFQRINTEAGTGGIIGVFRQGAAESKRLVTINYLQPLQNYVVKKMDGKIIAAQTGREFQEKGFNVELTQLHDGELFEVSLK